MGNIIGELLPYIKSFAGLYIIWNIITGVFCIGFSIYIFKSIIKSRKEFDREFKNRWK